MQGQTPPAAAPVPAQPARATAPASAPGARLPVRRVVLYKSGIGYFEHLGRVSGAQTVSIDLTSGQLDDVLKSLTTVDLGGGQVTGITYNTEAPLEEQLRKLRLPLGADVSRTALLEALRGARVEVRAAGAIVPGRILGVDSRVRGKDETQRTIDELTIVGRGRRRPHLRAGARRRRDDRRGRAAPRPRAVPRRDRRGALAGSPPAARWRRAAAAVATCSSATSARCRCGRRPTGWSFRPRRDASRSSRAGPSSTTRSARTGPTSSCRSSPARRSRSSSRCRSRSTPSGRWCRSRPARVVAPEIHGGAMTSGPASLRGRIADTQGGNIPGATVKLLAGGREVASTTSDGNGMYQFSGVPSGTVTVQVVARGLQDDEPRAGRCAARTTSTSRWRSAR